MSLTMLDRISKKADEIGSIQFLRKIGKNEFDLVKLIADTGSRLNDVKVELADWDRVLQFKAAGARNCYLEIKGQKMTAHEGEHVNPDVTFETNTADDLLGMLSGEADGTQLYMSGGLRIDGSLADGIKFGNIGKMLQQELTTEKIMEIWKLKPQEVAEKLGIS